MSTFRYVVADVFTDTPLAGNQLAVFTDARDIPDELLQPLAKEMAFSETVFVYPTDGEAHVRIRIFTPATEIPFAGHPTLGTAFVLAQPMQLEVIAIETGSRHRSGLARARGPEDRVRADAPADPDHRALRRGDRCSRRLASSAPSCPSSSTTTGCASSTSR